MTFRKVCGLALVLAVALSAGAAQAREDVGDYAISDAMAQQAAKEKLQGDVTFYFGKETYPKPLESMGRFQTSKKTNTFNKSDKEACESAFVSAMEALRDRAVREGGNAVVDIQSNYDDDLTESQTTFKCGVAALMAGVALQGRVVKLPQ